MPARSEPWLRFGTPDQLRNARTRTRLADGTVVGCDEPGTVIDAEYADQPVPPALARRFGVEDFWGRWTRAECAAKLADVPIVRWLHEHGLEVGDAQIETVEVSYADRPLVVSVGRS